MTSYMNYKLDENLKSQIICAKTAITSYLGDIRIYLFGSIAKGRYSRRSDIDLLVLIQENMSTKELRVLRHELEDQIESLKISRKVDVKLYNELRYRALCENPCFEQAITKDLIDIVDW